MGWLFHTRDTGQTKKQFIEERCRTQGATDGGSFVVIAHSCVGNVLYKVEERRYPDGTSKRFIGVDLIAKQRGGGWGYKDMTEHENPNACDCPLKLLRLAPLTEDAAASYAGLWRQRCMAAAAARRQK